MSDVQIINPGLLTTVQDAGRPAWQHLGVPQSGACDSLALRLANLLVGNDPEAAALECTLSGPVLRFNISAVVAVTGANVELKLNGYQVPMWMSLMVKPGDQLDLTRITSQTRAYVAFAGGVEAPSAMGSRSTYPALELAPGLRRLQAGDSFTIGKPAKTESINCQIREGHPLRRLYSPAQPTVLRLVPGSQCNYFDEAAYRQLVETEFTVAPESDRMGIRLQGTKLALAQNKSLISDGIPLGAMQITRDGTPIIMLADRQPTGGYPKIANVTLADLPRAGQLRPGDRVRFQWITREEALTLYREQCELLTNLRNHLYGAAGARCYRVYIGERLYQVSVIENVTD